MEIIKIVKNLKTHNIHIIWKDHLSTIVQYLNSFFKNNPWEFPGGLVVKNSVLSLLWLGFNPRPGNFCYVTRVEKNKTNKQTNNP